MTPRNARRSDRISLSVPIEVSWTAVSGRTFTEEGRTIAVSRYGATIVLRQALAAMQQVTVRCPATGKSASALIVGNIGSQPSGSVYGVAVQDPEVNLWDIEFPALSDAERAVSRALLECTGCHSREVVYLDELQTELFDASHGLSLHCKRCAAWTIWKLAQHGASPEPGRPAAHPASPAAPASAPERRTQNQRKDIRVSLKLTACIRQLGVAEEVVTVDNASRGGFRFFSPKTYFIGSSVEVAVPYTPGAANIFVPARIVRSRDAPRKKLKEYGVAYVQPEVGTLER